MTRFHFGTSGWSYKEWVGPFYTRKTGMFSYYSSFFNTVEINTTFYRYPSGEMMYGLARTSSKNFVFSTKLPRLITHDKHLDPGQEIEGDLIRFLRLLDPLKERDKLGCILIQLPPSFAYEKDLDKLKVFLEMLPDDYEFAAEFRNHSWMRDDTWKLLKENGVAYCIVDEPLLPPEVRVTADFAYFRWHGRNARPWYDYLYSEKELREWVPRIEKTRDKVDKIYGYFNNHFHGYAVENCVEILEMLDVARPELVRIKDRIIQYNVQKRPEVYDRGIDEFFPDTSRLGVEDLLQELTNNTRIERGRRIEDSELVIEEASNKTIKARIRRYRIELDLEEKVLIHDCDDWRKGLGMKRLCKHVVKLFLTIPREKSKEIIKDIIEKKDYWKFQP